MRSQGIQGNPSLDLKRQRKGIPGARCALRPGGEDPSSAVAKGEQSLLGTAEVGPGGSPYPQPPIFPPSDFLPMTSIGSTQLAARGKTIRRRQLFGAESRMLKDRE